jgi:hypothetical protein
MMLPSSLSSAKRLVLVVSFAATIECAFTEVTTARFQAGRLGLTLMYDKGWYTGLDEDVLVEW